ncbi:hypothetical protein D4010_17035 [Shigella sonnei]|nr:hypothetical protein [Shigella sonnei]
MVICFDLAIDQIAQSGLSSLKVIYYSAQLFRTRVFKPIPIPALPLTTVFAPIASESSPTASESSAVELA